MEYAIVLALLMLKHWLMAVLVDNGYSDSRDLKMRRWRRALAIHCLGEMSGSLVWFGLQGVAALSLAAFVVIELMAGVLTCLLERRAPWYDLVYYHLAAEAVYWVILVAATSFLLR